MLLDSRGRKSNGTKLVSAWGEEVSSLTAQQQCLMSSFPALLPTPRILQLYVAQEETMLGKETFLFN